MINIAIIGIFGRMGQEISKEVAKSDNFNLISGLCKKTQLTNNTFSKELLLSSDINEVISGVDVVIDFSNPDLSLEVANAANKKHINYICGTTGFTDEQFTKLKILAENSVFIWGSNMSIGINLLLALIKKSSSILGDQFNAEIIEMHHKYKKDSPSGTAISLGKAIADSRNHDFNKVAKLSREGILAERSNDEIGFATLRGGSVIGDHQVIFAEDSEIITLGHKACDRAIFAKGALKAALAAQNKANGFYNIQDIFI